MLPINTHVGSMIDTERIRTIVEEEFQGTNLFLVGIKQNTANEIEITVDSDTSVDIDACATLTRKINDAIDREEEDFSLTVMSAGIGSELRSLRQYRKLVGSSVEVLLTSGIKLLARLDEVTDEGITLSYEEKQAVEGKKRKQLVKVSRTYPFSEIKYTKEWLDFK